MSRELKGMAIILVVYLVGEVVSRLIGGFIPGSILGMLLLFVLLQSEVVKEDDVKGVCNFLLNNMMLLFVPITAGIMVSYKVLSGSWLGAGVVMVATTILVLVVVGLLQQYLGRRWRR